MAHPEGSGRVTYDTVAIGLSNAVRPGCLACRVFIGRQHGEKLPAVVLFR